MLPLEVIDCTDCGRCCDQQGTPPMLSDEFAALPPELQWDRDAHDNRYDLSEPCLWYDIETKRCRHYDHRPRACREFRVGNPYCLEFRQKKPH